MVKITMEFNKTLPNRISCAVGARRASPCASSGLYIGITSADIWDDPGKDPGPFSFTTQSWTVEKGRSRRKGALKARP